MVDDIQQFSLFNVVDYGGRKTRGKYKPKEKKVEPVNPYTELSILYQKLANFFPIPILNNEVKNDNLTNYTYFNSWYSYYAEDEEATEYKVIEAELIGTEDLFIQERLFLHKKLLDLVNNKGYSIYKAAEILQPYIKGLNDGSLILE